MSEIPGAYLLLAPIPAVTESPSFERVWRMRGRGGVTPLTASGELAHLTATVPGSSAPSPTPPGEVAYDDDVIGGAGTAPPAAGGAVAHQAVALAGAIT